MALRIFSVTGEALNFGGRRMATIMRVSWLPVVLLLILNMATVFAYLSVIAGEAITFSEISTFTRAQQLLAKFAPKGFEESPMAMWSITAGNLALQTLLIASFMAPLIRYAGLGEKPRPGAVRLSFGPDQLRYIFAGTFSFLFVAVLVFAPIAAASFYVLKYILAALSQTTASFPDPNSLHTIEVTTVGQDLASRGASWIYNLVIPLATVAPVAILMWLIVYLHFHPRNRPAAPERRNPALRAAVTLGVVVAALGGGYLLLRQTVLSAFQTAASVGGGTVESLAASPANAILFSGLVIYFIVGYFNLRLYPYPGVAVCRKSILPGKTFKVSRGWDIIRLQIILLFVGLIMFLALLALNIFIFPWVFSTIDLFAQAVATSTRLVDSGVTADWVKPLFIWISNSVKILINIFWTFFSYGVLAGLYGRLYRESERDETSNRVAPHGPEVWRRNGLETEGV